MGHEYVEMKNSHAAIEAYRRAVGSFPLPLVCAPFHSPAETSLTSSAGICINPDCNPRDYRAWYGLGQTYELLDMPQYAIQYYNKATALRPFDWRMWHALAQVYENSDRCVLSLDLDLCWRHQPEQAAESCRLLSKLQEGGGDQVPAARAVVGRAGRDGAHDPQHAVVAPAPSGRLWLGSRLAPVADHQRAGHGSGRGRGRRQLALLGQARAWDVGGGNAGGGGSRCGQEGAQLGPGGELSQCDRQSGTFCPPSFSLSVFALGRTEPDFDLICLLPHLRPSFLHAPSPENRTYQKRRRRLCCSRRSTASSMPSHEHRLFSSSLSPGGAHGSESQTSEASSGTFPQVRAYWSLFATGQTSIV